MVSKNLINGTTPRTTTDHNSINIAFIVDNGTVTQVSILQIPNVTYVCVGEPTNGNKIMGTDCKVED
ncbi:MAG: hypothetical protein CM15mV78_300 [uncultured marine virus]|nr:MAG: hypothetical protein CM15mV78_300 [uncultured marine virus]